MRMKTLRGWIILAAIAALAGCSNVKRELGVGRNSPDEFAVVKRAPLTLPPDYELRPPSSQGTAPAADASNQAQTALLGKTDAPAKKDTSEEALLEKMGAQDANSSIRDIISAENGYIAVKNRTVADKLIFWNDDGTPDESKIPDSVVDPKAEKERLDKNKEEGKPLNDGKVPTIEKKKSTLDKIF